MAREIKFRGKNKFGWHYGYFTKDYAGNCWIISIDGEDTCLVDESTIGQFTGRFDNKGNDIYEGDYVSCLNSGIADGVILWCPIQCMFKVKWVSKTYSQVRGQSSYYTENGEKIFSNTHLTWTVIGNIHEREVDNG